MERCPSRPRVSDGNEQAWAALIAKYKNLIYSIPLKYGAPPQDAADIFQSVCLELFSELPRLRKSRALRSWLITVTAHQSFHWKRKLRRRAEDELTPVDEEELAADLPPDLIEEVEREQILREAVARAAAALPGDHQAAVLRVGADRVPRPGRAARPGHRLDRLHPRPLPEASRARAAGAGFLVIER